MQPNYTQINDNIKHGQYRKLGEGSGRFVYDMGNGYVIKYGRNHKGLAQNEQEHEIFHIRMNPLLATVVGKSQDNRILVMEKANPYFKPIYLCKYYHISNMRELLTIPEVKRLMEDYHLVSNDLVKLSSWGEARQRPVLIDYGFTIQVRHRYYNGFF